MGIVQLLSYAVLSVAIGLFMGIIGGGGGGVYVVLLMFLLRQNAKTAAMTALVLSTFTLSGAAWQYCRKKQFRFDYFIALAVSDSIGTLTGAKLIGYIGESTLKIIILCVLLLSGLSSLIKIKSSKSQAEKIAPATKKMPAAASAGIASGLITGTTGLSASTMLSSLLIGLFDFPPALAVGTTTLVSFAGNLIGILLLLMSDWLFRSQSISIDPKTVLIFGIGSAAGAVFGAKCTAKINRKVLTVIISAMAILPGIYLAIKK